MLQPRSKPKPIAPREREDAPQLAPFDPRQERALVRRFAAGDASATSAVGERLACVRTFLGRMNRRHGSPLPPEVLSDLVHDTVLVILGKLPTFHCHTEIEAFAWQVCRFEFRNACRRERRERRRIEAGRGIAELPAAGDEFGLFDLREAILQGLAALPGLEAAIVASKHFDGLTFDEIGVRLSISPNTAKTCYCRARDSLRLALRDLREERS
jgi:RNA polymerase sigma factor (sigma-70 family)